MGEVWRRFGDRASIASNIMLMVMSIWWGLRAYFIGEYELATAWVFALVWAVSGLLQHGTEHGD